MILTVGLGIAATTTIVGFMTPYLIRELPFEDPAQLVQTSVPSISSPSPR